MHIIMNADLMRRVAMLMVVVMGLVSFVPRLEASFIPSEESFPSVIRQQNMATIQKALEHKLVRERLTDLGYTDDEIVARVNQLTDAELHSFASQLDSLSPAGDGLGVVIAILVVVLLVILILKLSDKKIVIS